MVLISNTLHCADAYSSADSKHVPLTLSTRRINLQSFQSISARNCGSDARVLDFVKSIDNDNSWKRRNLDSKRNIGSRKKNRFLNDLHILKQAADDPDEVVYKDLFTHRPAFGFLTVGDEFYKDGVNNISSLLTSSSNQRFNDNHHKSIVKRIRHEIKCYNSLQLVLLLDECLNNIMNEKLYAYDHDHSPAIYASESFNIKAEIDTSSFLETQRSYRIYMLIDCPSNPKATAFARYWMHLICSYYGIYTTSTQILSNKIMTLGVSKKRKHLSFKTLSELLNHDELTNINR
ncbi:conserved eukaryotic protein, R3H domain-containing [Schizosaccharomyces pombe]|uniref:Uncharacterized protein C320.06 n=1 Tax=Schizosaccharomyces pombe (strain 972 / ATCC 24843) TaxID=284812 RepID=YCN6_SCHPO|nr:uncharacterized protein SPCC320.06 [Schizosaccharomyces pombe]O59783.1 RecName: Full=Uncharacterized protein C320.06 [Schizosaccharomyces pombe 972h-]CAA18308.1 conserved fungal protein [Schizosaccharomyces pombe]|eukprot:NP_587723.1 uncharacterized protein SPCC320.06 [Schizosaccharomyces pombe]